MAAYTDFKENKLIDFMYRGQALGISGASAAAGSGPSIHYVGLLTAMPTDSTAGTEIPSVNGYARVAIASSLANWAGTQGAGSTTASTGSSGTTSNNVPINFPTPTGAGWGTGVAFGLYDAAVGGNLLDFAALDSAQTFNVGNAVSFPPGTLIVKVDAS